jgi:DNA invertase Pin-like site-specific DNA recombinase
VNGGITSARSGVTAGKSVSHPASRDDAHALRVPILGYASGPAAGDASRRELGRQTDMIVQDCERRALDLIEVVHEREPVNGKVWSRPGLAYALQRISNGEAAGLVVSELRRLTHSAAELGKVIEWLLHSNARFVAVAHGLDTDNEDGRLAADLLVEVSRWESARLSERTRHGLQAARRNGRASGRPAVIDDPQLRQRIGQMRAQGMTLQAIADRLNAEGVPTVRGGAKWRHSSVQAAAGYRRPPRLIAGGSGRP